MNKAYEKKGYIEENYHYFHLKDKDGQELDFHFHEFDKLVLLLSGNVTYALEHEEYDLKPWDILLVPHHTIHRASIDQSVPYERIIIYFNRMYLRSIVPSVDIMESFTVAQQKGKYLLQPDEKQKNLLKELFVQYEEHKEDTCFGSEAYRDSLIIQLLICLGRLHTRDASRSFNQMDEKIQAALTYMNEHLTQELSVDLLAEYVNLSRSYFMHLFKQETGISVHASILQKRLLYAARRIREGALINEAVMESGFSDYTTFYRSFKNAFGISPRELKGE